MEANQIHTLPPAEAARWLGVDEGAVRALVQARYLSVIDGGIPLADVRAFQARNAEGGTGNSLGMAAQSTDVDALIDALDRRVDDLSGQAHEMFVRVIPEARQWSAAQRESFIVQAKGRFGAILAVTSHGSDVDEALSQDLQEVGANAAWAGTSLPHLLLVLRISRDLLLQSALRIAEDGHGRWNAILATFTSRLLPSVDRLTDAISSGYWRALLQRQSEEFDRLSSLIENVPYGVYEADIDGLVQYANPAMAAIVGRAGESLVDMPLAEVFKPVSGSVDQLLAEPAEGVAQVNMVVVTGDQGQQFVEVDTVVRRINDEAVGFAGIVHVGHDPGAGVDLTPLIRHVFELRRSIEILTDAGNFIAGHGAGMTPEQLVQAGESVQRQAVRLLIIVDELDADRKALQPPVGGHFS